MIAIASDHGGFALKQELLALLKEKGYEYNDLGCYDTQSVDYPAYAAAVCREVLEGRAEKGVLVCGTGIGMSIAANKFPGIRAALVTDCYSAEMTRQHNDANVLAMGARIIGPAMAEEIVHTFLTTEFEGGRHERRVNLVMDIEKG